MVSKLEVDIRMLLANCEELSKDETNFWRLKKFIKSLDTMINELKETETYASRNSVSDYFTRLQELKVITNYKDSIDNKKFISRNQAIYNTTGDDLIKEVNQIKSSKKLSELRKELLNEDDGLRKRSNLQQNGNMDLAMKFYTDTQEKIAEDMLALTRNLREQTETANKIIKNDTETINKSTFLSEKNINALASENTALQHHSSRACNCWKWLMIALVMIIFIFMVLFMRVMKKKV